MTKSSLPQDVAQPATEMASTQRATNRLAAAPITPAMAIPASDPVTAIDDERCAISLLVATFVKSLLSVSNSATASGHKVINWLSVEHGFLPFDVDH